MSITKNIFIRIALATVILLIVSVVVLVIVTLVVLTFRGEYRKLQAFTTRDGYIIDIITPYEWEVSRPVYGRVSKGETILHRGVIGYTRARLRELKFQLIETNDGLAVIAEQSNPHIVLLVFDAISQQWWTGKIGVEKDVVREEFFHRLNVTNPSSSFIPSDEVPTNNYTIKVLP